MIFVFETETGGDISFAITSSIPALSGYVDVVGVHRSVYRFGGFITSGNLYISKSGLSSLSPGNYTLLPQVIDDTNARYFLAVDDLQIIDIP